MYIISMNLKIKNILFENNIFLYEGTLIKNAKIIKSLHLMIEKNKFVFVQIIFFSLSFFDKEFQKYYSDIIKES